MMESLEFLAETLPKKTGKAVERILQLREEVFAAYDTHVLKNTYDPDRAQRYRQHAPHVIDYCRQHLLFFGSTDPGPEMLQREFLGEGLAASARLRRRYGARIAFVDILQENEELRGIRYPEPEYQENLEHVQAAYHTLCEMIRVTARKKK